MDSRKILEIYKLINDRSPKPVSAWPTIADIPQGMRVLDSDGVVKQKVGDYLIPASVTIIGSGLLAAAPVASAANQNMYYMSTDYGLCKCVSVFNNEGTDFVNCGRPSFLSYLSTVTRVGYRCKVGFRVTTAGYAALVGLGGSTATRQLAIGLISTGISANIYIGGVITSPGPSLQAIGVWGFIDVKYPKTGTPTITTSSGSFTASSGSVDYAGDLYLGALSNGGDNFEGMISSVKFWDDAGTLLDIYDFNTWDGSSSGMSLMGNPYTVTKGSPFTERVFAWVPLSVL